MVLEVLGHHLVGLGCHLEKFLDQKQEYSKNQQ